MNVIQNLTDRINDALAETKSPCKSYKTEESANKAIAGYAETAGKYFDRTGRSARYVVFFHGGLNRWVGALDYTELFSRSTSVGGYVGIIKGVFAY